MLGVGNRLDALPAGNVVVEVVGQVGMRIDIAVVVVDAGAGAGAVAFAVFHEDLQVVLNQPIRQVPFP